MDSQQQFEKLRMELRRGALVLAVLTQLQEEHYGYSLRKQLSEQGLEIDEGTLYPLVRRLEKQGLLSSEWREENKRKKRFYQLSKMGREVLSLLKQEWMLLDSSISPMLTEV